MSLAAMRNTDPDFDSLGLGLPQHDDFAPGTPDPPGGTPCSTPPEGDGRAPPHAHPTSYTDNPCGEGRVPPLPAQPTATTTTATDPAPAPASAGHPQPAEPARPDHGHWKDAHGQCTAPLPPGSLGLAALDVWFIDDACVVMRPETFDPFRKALDASLHRMGATRGSGEKCSTRVASAFTAAALARITGVSDSSANCTWPANSHDARSFPTAWSSQGGRRSARAA